MLDLSAVINRMVEDGTLNAIINNPLAQFGTQARPYLGATLMPERTVPRNKYEESAIKYRTVVANDGTRHSPVQIKSGALGGTLEVSLGYQDHGSHLTADEYDQLLELIRAAGGTDIPMAAVAQITRWIDSTVLLPLIEKIEKMRWEAIVDAEVPLSGDNNYTGTVSFSNPTGHRVAAGDSWSDNAYDPMEDIQAIIEAASNKGYTINRIITSTPVIAKLQKNQKMKEYIGSINIASGAVVGVPGILTRSRLNEFFLDNQMPIPEVYDLQYQTQTGSGYFLKRDVMVFACTTGRDMEVFNEEADPIVVSNTLGYVGIGTPSGQSAPGRVIKVRNIDDSKPPRLEAEAWQCSFPVPTDPEAVFVITDID